MQKSHIAKRGKRGFTLVELSVVLALMAILAIMIVSFSVPLSGFVDGNKAEYAFLVDHAALKDSLCSWVAEHDAPECVFSIEDGTLTVTEGGTEKTVHFTNGVLSLGGEQVASLDAIDGVFFTAANDKLIKCVTSRNRTNGEPTECTFVFYIRSGSIVEVTGDA